jgi:LmbE family N-acetylglucosaminyl deacetylase
MISEAHIVPYSVSDLAPGPWLVFAPHADDETFGMGGTLLRARDAGIQVHLVIMTDGALGGQQDDLVRVRQREAWAVAAALGLASVFFLGEPDRGLAPQDALVRVLADLISERAPACVFLPGMYEPHPDHRATALLVWAALQQLPEAQRPAAIAYEISVQNPVNRLVDITAQMPGKRALMMQYLSQLDENNYIEIVEAMNRLRTFSLPRQVSYAEGFYHFSRDELQQSLQELLQRRVQRFFDA